ncbi:Fic family protein [Thiorhodovibrio winogradskyi]|uniref:Fic family protein n=1 Tax=Thiorhodovibrio winogradskyi TaxID=77007 RepID=UPI002E2CD571|nr:Fic family protein [Thiorhodovibrio winogradskyi]
MPAQVAPGQDEPLEQLLFALKHEGVNLPVLAQVLKHIPGSDILRRVQATPSSRYVRVLGFLWEAFQGRELEGDVAITGPTVDLFDAKRYLTAPGQRNARWKVNFNGLGSLRYAVTVERTPAIEGLLALNILDHANAFVAGLGPQATDRALAWAYLHETENSFALERETPSQDKAEAFVALLKQAHQPRPMDEDYLVELQNAAITNPLDRAAAYRHEQNWLRGPLRGAAGITYVPPPPELVTALMDGVLVFANALPKVIDPLVAAAIASFGLVFIHPFMDGNGRLSRFLFHYALCQSARMGSGLLLPVSVAMKRNEAAYLNALQSFSMPMRRCWDVRWLSDETYDFRFRGDEALYRYWDATQIVEFSLNMARQALEKDLREETEFLDRFDRVYRQIDERFDVRGNALTTLVITALQNNGKVSKNRRKQFQFTVPAPVFDAIEQVCEQALK